MLTAPAQYRAFRAPASRRWIALLIASLLLHLIFLGWVGGKLNMPSAPVEQTPTAIIAQLHPARQAAPKAPVKPEAARKKTAKKRISPRETSIPAQESTVSNQNEAVPQSMEIPPIDLTEATEAFLALEGVPREAVTPQSEPQIAAAPEPDVQHYKVNIPPSAELKYNVEALRDGQMVYGSGKIRWNSDGGNYTVNGEASILFFTLLNFRSAGVIDDSGIAPVIYSEKRFRRSETNTHFHRERNTISFSASTITYPRKGGEQDRASIVWQLTGIGRGDGEKFKPGAEIDFFVAGVRDAAPWRVRVVGEEQIEVDGEKLVAWHVVRVPKPGTYDQKLDIWLAPQREWYPVKLRFTETNGEYLDMLLSSLTIVAAD